MSDRYTPSYRIELRVRDTIDGLLARGIRVMKYSSFATLAIDNVEIYFSDVEDILRLAARINELASAKLAEEGENE